MAATDDRDWFDSKKGSIAIARIDVGWEVTVSVNGNTRTGAVTSSHETAPGVAAVIAELIRQHRYDVP